MQRQDSEDGYGLATDSDTPMTPTSAASKLTFGSSFLFGNIDNEGRLESSEIFDEETIQQINHVPALHGIVCEIVGEDKSASVQSSSQEASRDSGYGSQEASQGFQSVDYGSIEEVADVEDDGDEEEFQNVMRRANEVQEKLQAVIGNVVSMAGDGQMMPPPPTTSVTSVHRTMASTTASVIEALPANSQQPHRVPKAAVLEAPAAAPPGGLPTSVPSSSSSSSSSLTAVSASPASSLPAIGQPPFSGAAAPDPSVVKMETKMETTESGDELRAPLADMMPEQLKGVDISTLFPEFKRGKVLRFLRLFGPSSGFGADHTYRNYLSYRKRWKTTKGPGDGGPGPDVPQNVGEEEWEVKLDMGYPPAPDQCMPSDLLDFAGCKADSDGQDGDGGKNKDVGADSGPKVAPWRYGAAQYWYDSCGVSATGEDFDYGFKLKDEKSRPVEDAEKSDDSGTKKDVCGGPPEEIEVMETAAVAAAEEVVKDACLPECYEMVTQSQWEDDIIFNADDVRQKIMATSRQKAAQAGWIPNNQTRFFPYKQQGDRWRSIFPVEKEELVYHRWEDDIIWDATKMTAIPTPPVTTLDPNDDNIILGIPADVEPDVADESGKGQGGPEKRKKKRQSTILLVNEGYLKEEEEEEEEEPQTIGEKDPFNLSNDEFYNPKLDQDNALRLNVGSSVIQHSIPAAELQLPFFPTNLGVQKLRSFHRPVLKRFSHGPLSVLEEHPVISLAKHIRKKAKEREQERLASGGGEMFFMRGAEDLSGRDGDLILAEYSEEHPPLVSQPGMTTNIKN